LPLRSATFLIGESGTVLTETLRGAPSKAATAMTGEPLTAKAIDGPLPRPISTAPEVRACCSFASPARALTSTSRLYLAKMPSSTPTFSEVNSQERSTDFATRSLSAACAPPAKTSSAAAEINVRARASTILISLFRPFDKLRGRNSFSYLVLLKDGPPLLSLTKDAGA